MDGAVERNRTSDLLITNQLLYRLSYNGLCSRTGDAARFKRLQILLGWSIKSKPGFILPQPAPFPL
jgi:hypothetical protein